MLDFVEAVVKRSVYAAGFHDGQERRTESGIQSESLIVSRFLVGGLRCQQIPNAMHSSKVLEKIRCGETAFGISLRLFDSVVFEMAAGIGFDAIWLDLEHHATTIVQARELVRATRAGGATDVVARPAKGEYMQIGRLLEAGVHGIMYPRCESVAEAAEVVKWTKFHPIGQRGFDGAGADGDYMSLSITDYLLRANRNTFLILQIENQAALSCCEEMLALDGVDMLMLGPGDFSILSGHPGDFGHAALASAQTRIAVAARNLGKHWASVALSPDHVRRLASDGASLVFHGADIVMLRNAFIDSRTLFAAANAKLTRH
jgi:4-hydroxy-2-oxoheptanedioate aldolase